MKKNYLFTSKRLGFRNWKPEDLQEFAEINTDLEVMEHFPKPLSLKETENLMNRLEQHYSRFGFTYFATEIIGTGEFIGFIGLLNQDYRSDFTPNTDIGWRLKKSSWGNGYATEGAKRCLEYAFTEFKINQIISVCTVQNSKSEHVMKKIGMKKVGEFIHPKLKEYPGMEHCLCYRINKKR